MRACLIGIAIALVAGPAAAGPVERACLQSGRAPSAAICGCIEDAARLTLAPREQGLAARLILEPERAERLRMSRSRRDFWERYRTFGETAQAFCGT